MENLKNAICTIKQEKKNLEKLKNEVEETGIIKLKDQKTKVRNINKFHDIRFKKIILNLKNNIGFIKEFNPHNMFIPLFNQIKVTVNTGDGKKDFIKKSIENKKPIKADTESFMLSIFKKDVRDEIKNEISKKANELMYKLNKLSKIVYEEITDKDPEIEEEQIKELEKQGKRPLTRKGKLWDFLISTTPNKKLLASYIDILLDFSMEEIMAEKEEVLNLTDPSFLNKIRTYKNLDYSNTLQPLRTSLLLFNQYLSLIEKEIVIEKYYKEENFTDDYRNFLNELKEIKNIFELKIELTKAQKILTYSYIKDIKLNIKSSKKLQPITLINTSEVGSGKTFTIPFVSYIIASKYLEHYNKKSIFIIITEANLLLETKQKLIEEVGLDEEHIEIIYNNKLENHKILPWKIYLLSKNRLNLIDNYSIRNFAKMCKKKNLLINLILDEASYLKNNTSKTSEKYSDFKSKLIKEKSLGFEMLMTATPVSNDTSDMPYIVNPNKKIVSKLKKEYYQFKTKYENINDSFQRITQKNEDLTLRELLKIAAFGYNKPVKIDKTNFINPKTLILASAYHSKYFDVFEKLEKLEKDTLTPKEETTELLCEIGYSPEKTREKNKRKGVKSKDKAIKLLDCLSDLSDIKGIDRILNSENINTSVQTNSIILDTNFIEATAFNEMIKNARLIKNFQNFKELENTIREFNCKIDEIEEEKFQIRHFILAQILDDLEMIDTSQYTSKITEEEKTYKIHKIKLNRVDYINALQQVLRDNPDELIKNMIIEINPNAYFKTIEIKKQLNDTSISNQQRKELENYLSKLGYIINHEINSIMDFYNKPLKENVIKTLEKDINRLNSLYKGEISFKPLSLSSYSKFIQKIEEQLKIEPRLSPIFENPHIYEKVIVGKGKILNIYSTIFQASESLNMPIISKHLKRTARTLKKMIEDNGIIIQDFSFEKAVKFIAENSSTTITTMKKIKDYCNKNNTPALLTTNYKNSIDLIKDENDDVITGSISHDKRKKIINKANDLKNKNCLIATAQSILKGISFYYIPYGVLPETPKNAEFRTQIAGRLRNLFPHQIEKINEEKIKEKEKCMNLLLKNQKYFDIISSEIMLAFPNIQQEKNILIESIKYISQHKDITDINLKNTISEEDLKYNYQFNAEIIEKYSEITKEKKMQAFIKYIKKENIDSLTMEDLLEKLRKYIDEIAENNLKKTTIYKVLK